MVPHFPEDLRPRLMPVALAGRMNNHNAVVIAHGCCNNGAGTFS